MNNQKQSETTNKTKLESSNLVKINKKEQKNKKEAKPEDVIKTIINI